MAVWLLPCLPLTSAMELEPRQAHTVVCCNRVSSTKVRFGKHAGMLLGSLPVPYLRWMATELHGERAPNWAKLAEEVLNELGTSNAPHTCTFHGHCHSGLASKKSSCLNEETFDHLGLDTDLSTYASILRRCTKARALSEGERVHEHLTRRGYAGNTFLGNLLVQFYSKCGNLGYARAVFDEIVHRNLYSTIIIGACVRNGHSQDALQLFGQMQVEGFEADKVTFTCVLDACANVAALEEGRDTHAAVACNGWELDVFLGSTLVNMYGKCGNLDDARAVFSEMPLWDVVSWSAMMTACTQNGLGKEAIQLFGEMQEEGVEPDKVTFTCVLDACAGLAALEESRQVHATVIGTACDSNVVVGTALINTYGKCRSLDDARKAFVEMPQRDLVCWNAMMAACAQNGHSKEALQLSSQIQREGFQPDMFTFICVLDACASRVSLEEGREMHITVTGNGWDSDLVVGSTLINMYGKCGSLDDARAVFAEISQQDVVSWRALMAACAENGEGKEALRLFGQIQTEGFEPDKITFTCVLDACASVAALEEGREMHDTIVSNGWESDVVVGTALVNMYGKCGSLDDARIIFGGMPLRDVVSWNAMMANYAQNGRGKEALELFGQMQAEGFNPDKITLTCVLTACSHTGLVADGRQYFASMIRDHGITPSVEHYLCMIDLLGRGGLLEETEDLILSMPFKCVASAWSSLLSSCRNHFDVERAVRAANIVCQLDPGNASTYVLVVK